MLFLASTHRVKIILDGVLWSALYFVLVVFSEKSTVVQVEMTN